MFIGMAYVEELSSFPSFIGTANNYGNELWGGREYADVSGLSANRLADRTFTDYDPITGRSYRQAVRMQVVRVSGYYHHKLHL
jgi:hypothetical protein